MAFNTATNWSTTSSTYTAASSAPTVCTDVVMNMATSTSNTITLSANTTVNSVTLTMSLNATQARTFILSIGTFNLTTIQRFTTINSTTTINSSIGTLEVSVASGGTLSIGGNLSCTNNSASAANSTIFANSGIMTVTGTTLANSKTTKGGNVLLQVGNSPATSTFNGSVTLDDGSSYFADAVLISGTVTNATGTFIFDNNLIAGPRSGVATDINGTGTIIFDGTSPQTVTDNCTGGDIFISYFANWYTNNPTVTFSAGTATGKLQSNGNLIVRGTSTFIIGATETYNSANTGTVTFTLNAGATMKLAGTTGGQTDSNFPAPNAGGIITPSLTAGTVEYNAAGSQTVFNTPTYVNLTIGDATTPTATNATAGGTMNITGNVTINSSAKYLGSTFTQNIGGNWTNNGTFTQGTSTINFNGNNALQTINGTSTSTFNILQVSKTSQANILLRIQQWRTHCYANCHPASTNSKETDRCFGFL